MNQDGALQCLNKAHAYVRLGDWANAAKFVQKSLRLHASEDARELLKRIAIEAAKAPTPTAATAATATATAPVAQPPTPVANAAKYAAWEPKQHAVLAPIAAGAIAIASGLACRARAVSFIF